MRKPKSVSYDTRAPRRASTTEAARQLAQCFKELNASLFGGSLPTPLITFQRRKRSYGYFASERFTRRDGTSETIDEIALNPSKFIGADDREIAQTLLHEMVHLWQFHFGKPPRRNYHDREWADKMLAVGLVPSDTGKPGGRQVGQKMSDYVDEAGAFAGQFRIMQIWGFRFSFQDRIAETDRPPTPRKLKVKYTCPSCEANVWGKPDLHIGCLDCNQVMTAADASPPTDDQDAAA
jgi:predicted SprT family Zn-dependent metalloprotease